MTSHGFLKYNYLREVICHVVTYMIRGHSLNIFYFRSNEFNSEHASLLFNGALEAGDGPSHTGSDIPSGIFGSDMHSGFLEHYGLDGPIVSSNNNNNPMANIGNLAAAPVVSGNAQSSEASSTHSLLR